MSINYSGIDEHYPVAGVDNDSQGFRDNFTLIKSGLGVADSAITDLQTKALVKSALTGTTIDNNMGGNPITNAVFEGCSFSALPSDTVNSSTHDISHASGTYQIIKVETDVAIRVINWPTTESYAKLILQLNSDGTARTVDLNTASIVNGALTDGVVYYSSNWPATLSIASTQVYTLVECWTPDGGATMFANYLGHYSLP